MAPPMMILLGCALVFLVFAFASSEVIEHTFHVHDITVQRMCKEQVITTVNGSFPGPTIFAREGDTLVVHVINNSPYNITIHWHGVFQLLSCWADGPEYISHCPIRPRNSYTYRFNITGQEGTLLWHAHSGFLRATVHGALVIRPKADRSYPFPKPEKEFPIVIGEWFNVSVVELEKQLLETGNGPNFSQGFTINGWPGDLYPCSSSSSKRRRFLDEPSEGKYSSLKLPSNEASLEEDIYTLKVSRGKTYLLRIINAALNVHMFFKIANHKMIVVAIDAFYTNPYPTDIIVLSPGQTVDVLVSTNQPSGLYYMATESYHPVNSPRFSHTTATAILAYDDATTLVPKMPVLPDYHDTPTAHKFLSSLTGLVTGPFWTPVPTKIDEHMFITVGMGIVECTQKDKRLCQGPLNQFVAASLNNVSFQLPSQMSVLEAYYNNVDGIYTLDFPDEPPYKFDFTNGDYRLDEAFVWTKKATKVKKLKYNTTVEIVLQSTSLVAIESHPIHLHGFNFYVVAQGYGNYDALKDRESFNLVNPQVRNTIAIPVGGWVVLRFQANNPGVWYMHCHLEAHAPIGLAMAFLVENGPTPSTTLPPPPADLPQC